ncbi:MAG TPA: 4-hydroxy-3-methylbut-2-enyl diphosphate reductase [Allosphingosinicella sp.]|nr:4-hydroxy-3-methylbut-2-enyl diphosphate reductase [Allosphingosinicella sp.]
MPAVNTDAAPAAALPPLRVILAAPRGFCAGVERAIQAVEEALRRFGPPVYVRRPIVHNLAVVKDLESKGAIFVEELDEVPPESVVLFSAHGIARHVAEEARLRSLTTFDAVCPLVLKVHHEVVRHGRDGRHVILVGHPGHPEVEGTLGQLSSGAATVVNSAAQVRALPLPRSSRVAYAIQTTYSVDDASAIVDAILGRFDDVAGPSGSDICYATTNRQSALRAIAAEADAVIVAGADFSSNANRLADLARETGCGSVQLVAEAAEIDWDLLSGAGILGITAAASTPETSIQEILAALAIRYRIEVEERIHVVESTVFRRLRLA